VNCLVLHIIVTESQSMRVYHYWRYTLVYKRKTLSDFTLIGFDYLID
jgi:hypothetical protein